ncbi:hypothetical protein COCMIDRAFT_98854, partial [Bipolaris oryzae ATCC 44560]
MRQEFFLENKDTEDFDYTKHGNDRHINANDSARSDKTIDTVTFNNRMDMAAELEQVQNQLQMSEMQNKHLRT